MAYDPLDPNTWNEPAGNTADVGLVTAQDTTIQDMGGYSSEPAAGTYAAPTQQPQSKNFNTSNSSAQNWFGPDTTSPWLMSNQPNQEASPSPTALALAKGGEDGWYKPIVESLSKMMQTSGGEVFAKTMGGAATGVLAFLAQRRKSRGDLEVVDRTNQYNVQTANARVARASAMPKVASMVKPGVTGQRKVGNQQSIAPVPQYTGLINAPRV